MGHRRGLRLFRIDRVSRRRVFLFVIYEAAAMASALAIYAFLAAAQRLNGAGVVATGILLNLAAAGVHPAICRSGLVVPFDHNGVFHLVQMSAIIALGLGLRVGMIHLAASTTTAASTKHPPHNPQQNTT